MDNILSTEQALLSVVELLKKIYNQKNEIITTNFENQLLNSKQLMNYLQVSEKKLIELERDRKIIPKRIGKSKRYLMMDILKYIKSL